MALLSQRKYCLLSNSIGLQVIKTSHLHTKRKGNMILSIFDKNQREVSLRLYQEIPLFLIKKIKESSYTNPWAFRKIAKPRDELLLILLCFLFIIFFDRFRILLGVINF
jgi:hypothetical protein